MTKIEERQAVLSRMRKSQLCELYRASGYVASEYPPEVWAKDEIVNAILDLEFPER